MWVGRKMEEKKNIKICFAASSGGHYEQLMMLKPLMEEYDRFCCYRTKQIIVQKLRATKNIL